MESMLPSRLLCSEYPEYSCEKAKGVLSIDSSVRSRRGAPNSTLPMYGLSCTKVYTNQLPTEEPLRLSKVHQATVTAPIAQRQRCSHALTRFQPSVTHEVTRKAMG